MVLESGTWDDEIAKWTPGIDATQVSYSSSYVGAGGKVKRDQNGFALTELKPQFRRHWGTVILDESHYLKGRKTSWTNALKKIDAGRIYLATGTPIPNWAHEAFTTLQFLWPDEAKPGETFGSYWRWVNDWFEVSDSFYNPMAKEIGSLREDRTWDGFNASNWRNRMILRLREQCLDLPELTNQRWNVRMSGEQKKAYTALKRDYVALLESGTIVDAWSEPAKLVKLLQLATGLECFDPGRLDNPQVKPSGKFGALASILEDRPRQTLVVGHFRSTVQAAARVAGRLGKRVSVVHGGVPSTHRTTAIRNFQQGHTDVMVATIATVREGMTLHQAGCDQIVRMERSFTPSNNEQVMRRIHRIGQEHPVTCIDLVTDGTYDEKVLGLLSSKTDEQMRALGTRELIQLLK